MAIDPDIEQLLNDLRGQVAGLSAALNNATNRIRDLEDFASSHLGLDWGTSLVDFNAPHPNQSVDTIEIGGGVIRESDVGIQIEQSSLDRAIWFLDRFMLHRPTGVAGQAGLPTTSGSRVSGSGGGSGGEFDLVVTTNMDWGFDSGAAVNSPESSLIMHVHPDSWEVYTSYSNFDWGAGAYGSSSGGVQFASGSADANGRSYSYFSVGAPLALDWGWSEYGGDYPHTYDGGTNYSGVSQEPGMMWYNATTNKFRGVISDQQGEVDSVDNFAMESWVTAAVAAPSTTWALTGDITPSQITANQNDYNPTGLSTASVLRLSSDASRDITGLAGGADGRVLLVFNVGSNNIVLKDESASSTAANRFALNGDITLAADNSVILWYDATSSRWRAL